MEKRQFVRQSASIDSLLSMGSASRFDCQISDYSAGGMLVMLKAGEQPDKIAALLETVGRQGVITFALPERQVDVAVSIVHMNDRALGLRLMRQDPSYLPAVRRAANLEKAISVAGSRSLSADQPRLTPARRNNLIKTTNHRVSQYLEDQFLEYFVALDRALLSEADQQKNQNAQQPFFDAMALLRRHHATITRSVIEKICADAIAVAEGTFTDETRKTSEKTGSLALVEKDEFDDWLVVRVSVSKAEMALREELIELQLRLDAAFAGRHLPRCHNPYSPAAICNAMTNAIRILRLNSKVQGVVFRVLHDIVLASMDVLYSTLNRLFIDADVLPNIDVTQYLAAQALKLREEKRLSAGPAATPVASGSAPEPEQAAAPEVERLLAPRPVERSTPVLEDKPSVHEAHIPVVDDRIEEPTANAGERVQKAYHTASRLWTTHKQLNGEPTSAATSGEQPASPTGASSTTLGALERLQNQVLQGTAERQVTASLKQQLQAQAGPAPGLNDHEQDSADMIQNLFDNIVRDERVAEDLKPELRKLEVPMLRVMLEDPTVFSADYHPARQAVNHIALLADRNSFHASTNKTSVIKAVETILENQGDSGFNQALLQLEKLVAREKSLVERNLQRLRETAEGQQHVRQARQLVERELCKRLCDPPVPVELLNLISHGWRDLMLLSLFREGGQSRSWEMTLTVVDQLVARLVPARTPRPAVLFDIEALVRLVRKGLSKIHDAAAGQNRIVSELEQLLQGTASASAWASFTPSSDLVDISEPERSVEQKRIHERWLKRARQLRTGQLLRGQVAGASTQVYQIGWIASDLSHFVIASQQGLKVMELSDAELAQRLVRGELAILDERVLPAVEQGLDSLVQTIYEKLAFDASRDQLTGLRNRKEFSQALASSVALARDQRRPHTLIFIDILQFKLINNTCGYEAGDRLLRELAATITSLAGPGAIIGRMGAAEFAVLAPLPAASSGYRLASDLKDSIEGSRFEDAHQRFVINTVVALIGFDERNDKVMELLRSVEAAAEICKKAGHKDIQIVQPGDIRLEERAEVMSWVTRINHALDQDNLKIRCQTIAPVGAHASHALPHYEVLLTVIDDNGEHLPPADFIKAAEEFNRMGAVDRWVIETVLKWMKAHEQELDSFGGFSINLSGHSLNDESFLDFIFNALVRYEVPRDKLIFELTETVAVANLEDAADFIREMRGIGCRFSLDDFGVGQSSFSYLKRLPVDFIKIDGSFVVNVATDAVDYALVRSITEMGHFLGKQIIAEYVSDAAILEAVEDIGVDYAQGFHMGEQVLLSELQIGQTPAVDEAI